MTRRSSMNDWAAATAMTGRARLSACLGVICVLGAWSLAAAQTGHLDHMGAHIHDGPHLRLTELRPERPGDRDQAIELLGSLREAIGKYRDHEAALAAGYEIFLENVPQDVYHFVHYGDTAREYAGTFDPKRPGSLLYVKEGRGYALVGAMYSAPASTGLAELDTRIPLSIGRWHAHVNVCLPEGITLDHLTRGDLGASGAHVAGMLDPSRSGGVAESLNRRYGFLADGRFGFDGHIADPDECRAAGGHFLPQAYGWMVHVHPFAGDDLAIAYGLETPRP